MKTHWIICFRQYGQWSSTRPFTTLKEAELHKKRHLDSNEIRDGRTNKLLVENTNKHIVDITFLEVELPA